MIILCCCVQGCIIGMRLIVKGFGMSIDSLLLAFFSVIKSNAHRLRNQIPSATNNPYETAYTSLKRHADRGVNPPKKTKTTKGYSRVPIRQRRPTPPPSPPSLLTHLSLLLQNLQNYRVSGPIAAIKSVDNAPLSCLLTLSTLPSCPDALIVESP